MNIKEELDDIQHLFDVTKTVIENTVHIGENNKILKMTLDGLNLINGLGVDDNNDK